LQIVRPVFPDINKFLAPFQAALASGQVTNGGHWVLEFERHLSEYLGVPTLVFCNGQMALMTMLRAAGVERGEVIVPSFTFAATPHAVRWCGAEPVFADIAANGSLCLDPEDVEHRITPNTVAILGVDAYGIACDYARLTEIGRRKGLKVVFDSAPSFGARVGGSLVGGFGDAQIFSFHATKAFTTMEGGGLCTHDPGIFARAKAIRNFGQLGDGDCEEAGINAKLTEVCALIGIEQLKGFRAGAKRHRDGRQRGADDAVRFRRNRPDDERNRRLRHSGGHRARTGVNRSVLRIALFLTCGMLLAAAGCSAIAGCDLGLVLRLVIPGLVLLFGLAVERWRYKPVTGRPPGADRVTTNEWFVDPESGKFVSVFYQPATGERRYVEGVATGRMARPLSRTTVDRDVLTLFIEASVSSVA
jgi:hypothetical protein